MTEWLTVTEAAAATGYSRDQIRRAYRKGALPAVWVTPAGPVIIRRKDLDGWKPDQAGRPRLTIGKRQSIAAQRRRAAAARLAAHVGRPGLDHAALEPDRGG